MPYLQKHFFSLVLYICKELCLPINLPFLPFFPLLFVYPLEPLPVSNVSIYDYKPSPETGVLFEIQYPEKYNVFTRVNISYWEGKDYRTMLYKGRRKLFHQNLILTLQETFQTVVLDGVLTCIYLIIGVSGHVLIQQLLYFEVRHGSWSWGSDSLEIFKLLESYRVLVMSPFFWILEEDLVVWIFVFSLKSAWEGSPSHWCFCVSSKQYKNSQALPSGQGFVFGL